MCKSQNLGVSGFCKPAFERPGNSCANLGRGHVAEAITTTLCRFCLRFPLTLVIVTTSGLEDPDDACWGLHGLGIWIDTPGLLNPGC